VRGADNLTTFMCPCLEIWEPQFPGTLVLKRRLGSVEKGVFFRRFRNVGCYKLASRGSAKSVETKNNL
jgi:hypothetical protein